MGLGVGRETDRESHGILKCRMLKAQKAMGFALVPIAGLYICEEEFLGDGSLASYLPHFLPRNGQPKMAKVYELYLTSLRDTVSETSHYKQISTKH